MFLEIYSSPIALRPFEALAVSKSNATTVFFLDWHPAVLAQLATWK